MIMGRIHELNMLEDAVKDEKSHFIAVYGRRRIGKTFLTREAFKYRFTFQHTGLSNGGMTEQIFIFDNSLREARGEIKKKVIFIDELS